MKDKPNNSTHSRVVMRRYEGGMTFVDVPHKFVDATIDGWPKATVERIPANGLEGQEQIEKQMPVEGCNCDWPSRRLSGKKCRQCTEQLNETSK